MSVSNPIKTVSKSAISCGGLTTVTLSFDAAAELQNHPADIVLVMDRSGSTTGAPMTAAKAAAEQFIDTVMSASGGSAGSIGGGSQLGLVSFAATASADQALTADTALLKAAVNAMTPGGSTSHQAGFEAARAMLAGSSQQRKVIVLFTDGLSNLGDADPVAEAIRQEGTEIYCIGLLTDTAQLRIWASDPADDHVASTRDPALLGQVFAKAAAQVVQAGALDMALREQLNPNFKITGVHAPSHGTVDVLDGQNLVWKADAAGAAALETVSLSFDAMHIGPDSGVLPINQSLTYSDRDGGVLDFPSPDVNVTCGGPIIHPESCPLPLTFTVEGCRDALEVAANETRLQSLGRIVQVDALIRNVCPGKQLAVAVLLSELDAAGVEHARGTKTMLIPAQGGDVCRDIQLKCISFVVPEALSLSGDPHSICASRGFRTRVLANYVDTDFVCCQPETVIL